MPSKCNAEFDPQHPPHPQKEKGSQSGGGAHCVLSWGLWGLTESTERLGDMPRATQLRPGWGLCL